MSFFKELLDGLEKSGAAASFVKSARAKIAELQTLVGDKDLEIERITRKAQYVADLAYNRGVSDAKLTVDDDHYWEDISALLKTPRHEAEFKKK